jgi:hypothetical protein
MMRITMRPVFVCLVVLIGSQFAGLTTRLIDRDFDAAIAASGPAGLAPGQNLKDAQNCDSVRINVGPVPQGYSLACPQWGAVADLQKAWVAVTTTTSSTALAASNTTTLTNTSVTLYPGGRRIHVPAASFTTSDVGKPFTLTVAGGPDQFGNLTTLSGYITGYISSTDVELSVPPNNYGASAAITATFTYGALFQAGDVGKALVVATAGSSTQQHLYTTIAGVTDPNDATMGAAAQRPIPGTLGVQVTWATDNYVALEKALAATRAAGYHYLLCPSGAYYTHDFPPDMSNVSIVGDCDIETPNGKWETADALAFAAFGTSNQVIPYSAPDALPPPNEIDPGVMLTNLKAAGTGGAAAAVVDTFGDSLGVALDNGATTTPTIAFWFEKRLVEQNPLRAINPVNTRNIGGQTWWHMDTVPNTAAAANGVAWYPNWAQANLSAQANSGATTLTFTSTAAFTTGWECQAQGNYSAIPLHTTATVTNGTTLTLTNATTAVLASGTQITCGQRWVDVVKADTPTLLYQQANNNDGLNFCRAATFPNPTFWNFLDIQAYSLTWTTQPDRLFGVPYTYSPASNQTTTQPFATADACGDEFIRSWSKAHAYGVFDYWRLSTMARDGYDPVYPPITRDLSIGFSTVVSLPYVVKTWTAPDWSFIAEDASHSPTTYWTAFTPAAGNGELDMTLGCSASCSPSNVSDNMFRLVADQTADTLGDNANGNLKVQCDLTIGYPGAGCQMLNSSGVRIGGTMPSVLGHFSITSGANTLTSTENVFVAGDDGTDITVPGANNLTQGTWLHAIMHYVSATQVTLWTTNAFSTAVNATVTLSGHYQVMLRGNPRIDTGIPIAALSQSSTQWWFSESGGRVTIFWLDQYHHFSIQATNFGLPIRPQISTPAGTVVNGFTLYKDAGGFGGLGTASGMGTRFRKTIMDEEVSGWQAQPTTLNNSAFASPGWGDGTNHPRTTNWIIQELINAQNLSAQ